MPQPETPPVVPARNDPSAQPLFVKATIADQAGAKPGYVRQWFHRTDPQNRGYFGKYQAPQRLGNPEIGYCMADPWTLVPRDEAKPGRKRDDDTVGIDTALTHGDLVCMETTVENFKRYQEEDRLKDQSAARRLGSGNVEDGNSVIRDEAGRPVAATKMRVGDAREFSNPQQLLGKGA